MRMGPKLHPKRSAPCQERPTLKIENRSDKFGRRFLQPVVFLMNRILVSAVITIVSAASLTAQQTGHDHAPGAHSTERLGKVSFANSGSPKAQAPFLRGLALLHSFEYEDAGAAFRDAQKADPAFTLAYWGEALTYAKLLWGLDDPAAARAALARLAPTPEARVAKARTERERAYGSAVEALYQDADPPTRVRGYIDQLRALTTRYPKDLEARALLAIALQMGPGLQGLSAEQRSERTNEAITLAQSIFDAQPDHPGGAHYLIHATDHPKLAARGLKAALAYAQIAPDAEHAIHMPSHIFVQLGRWDDVASSNERAWAASRAWVKARGVAPTELSFHALWWLQHAYLQQGRYRAASALIDTARAVLAEVDWTRTDAIDARYVVNQLQFSYAHESGDWNVFNHQKAATVPPPANATASRAQSFAFYDDFGIAFGAALQGDTIAMNARSARLTGTQPRGVGARALIAALDAKRRGDAAQYIASLQAAAQAEATVPHYGPPNLVPANELLGYALLETGRPAEAIAAFEKSLELMPNRSKSLRGLARAHSATGNADAAARAEAQLQANWQRKD